MVLDEQVCSDKVILESLKGESVESNCWSKMLKFIKPSSAEYLYELHAL